MGLRSHNFSEAGKAQLMAIELDTIMNRYRHKNPTEVDQTIKIQEKTGKSNIKL